MFNKPKTANDILIEAITNHVRVTLKEAIEHDHCVVNDVRFNRSVTGEYLISLSLAKPSSATVSVNTEGLDFNFSMDLNND